MLDAGLRKGVRIHGSAAVGHPEAAARAVETTMAIYDAM